MMGVVGQAKVRVTGLKKPSEVKPTSFIEPDVSQEQKEIVEAVKKTPAKLRHSVKPVGP